MGLVNFVADEGRALRLVISDEEDSLRPGFLEATGAALQPATSAAIRWRPEFFHKIKYTFDIGLRSTPDIYARVRAIRQWQVGEDTVLRFSDIARYGVEEFVADSVVILRNVLEDEKRRRTIEILKLHRTPYRGR